MFRPADCAEFPNDNPALHGGAIWRCLEPCAAATYEPPASLQGEIPPVPLACVEEEILVVGETSDSHGIPLAAQAAAAEIAPPEPPPAMDDSPEDECVAKDLDPFAVLVRLLQEVARAAGTGDETGVALEGLLGETRLDGAVLPAAAVDALLAGGHVDATSTGIRRSDALTRTVVAWRSILRGESEDFTACGSLPLDEWAADLVARVIGNPAQKGSLRRELRSRGIAAFGLVAQAA